jgi:glycosyltransferase involved in cell wall biosynthesis
MSVSVFYDHQTFSQQEYGGISRYFCELIKGVDQTADSKVYLSLLFSNNIHLREAGLKAYPFFSKRDFPKKAEILYRLNQVYNLLDLQRVSYDIFHATNYDPYFIPHLKSKPFVVTFYDAIHERFGGKYKELSDVTQIISNKKKLAEQATAVIAISESTKKDLVELLDVDPTKIHVVHLGSSFNTIVENTPPNLRSPYILYVGKRDAYKNFTKFLNAVGPILKKYKMTLICAGGGIFTADEQAFIQSLHLESYVTNERINDIILQGLYKSACAFVFPSLYEGFGIPVLEAMACDCPCVLSNTSSLPEVAGDAAIYFDPYDEESIAESVELVISDDTLRKSLITKGRQRLMQFSWDRTAAQTVAVYEQCL